MSGGARIAFFWRGPDTTIPSCLVESARRAHPRHVELVQLTDEATPEVIGVTQVVRRPLSPFLMVARLQAYGALPIYDRFTFFCDADSLFLDPLDIAPGQHDKLIVARSADFVMNPNSPEYYPEFVDVTAKAIMPYLFGAIAVRKDADFFPRLLQLCLQLPERFHRWYGDQVALKQYVDEDPTACGFLDIEKHLRIVRGVQDEASLEEMRRSEAQMITFKGVKSPRQVSQTLENLIRLDAS